MPSAFSGLEIAKRALYAQQSALHTTGHNIANANTEGYTRQRVNMEATTPYPYPSLTNDRQAGQMGTGVLVTDIQRLRESFLDLQFRGEIKNVGEFEAKVDTLEKIEVILNEPSDDGLQKTMDEFWNGWQKLASHPKDTAAREVVRENAVTMVESFAFIQREMVQQQNNVNEAVKTKAIEVQGYLDSIAQLNAKINDVVPHGYVPNDLYDQRDLILDKLSKIMDIEVKPVMNGSKDTGMVDVSIKDTPKINLVSGSKAGVVKAEPTVPAPPVTLLDGKTNKLVINIVQPDTTTTAAYNFSGGGEMKGLLEARDTIVPEYVGRIQALSTKIVEEVNTIHKGGIDLDGNKIGTLNYNNQLFTGVEPDPALPFFVSKKAYEAAKATHNNNDPATWGWMDTTNPTYAPKDAGDIIVNPLIMKSVNKIAAAQTGSSGDNKNALAIYALKENTGMVIGGETASFDSYTRSVIAKLGSDTREAQRMKGNVEALTGEVENRRQSVSGVSLDEEMSNMIKFQHAYNAAARTITAVDEMLDKVINGMGLVGR